MKIVYVLTTNLLCGGHIIVIQHVSRLAKRGHDVSICILDETVPATPVSFSWFPNFNYPVIHSKDFPEDVDICVATFWDTLIQVLKLPAKHKVYFVQSDETRFYDDLIMKNWVVLTYLCNIHYMTEAKWIVDWLDYEFGHQAAYIPNAIDTSIVHADNPISKKREDKLRILVEGTIDSPFKKVKEAIKASEGLGCEIWCVSNGGKPSSDWKIDRFFYKVDFSQMKRIYSSCDILVKLSNVEGFFGPPLEMMACGGVCIVSDVTGYDEYIVDEYNALVIPNGDTELARQALKRLIENKDLYKRLQINGRITADSMQWDHSIDKLESFFSSLFFHSRTSHVKGERIEVLRKLLTDYYFLKCENPEIINSYKLSRLEYMIINTFKKIKQIIPLSIRLKIKARVNRIIKQ
ncbi:glycosyltransferase family 4 protein [Pseudanabaena minima]|uniref:glycosyltransferase family 4 protein n=1 Tax=Pseudanabaena minima TaxID=890415 RepID=UPI003DA7C707